jgi:hypothetical protein
LHLVCKISYSIAGHALQKRDKNLHFLPEAKTQPFYRRYAPDKSLDFRKAKMSLFIVVSA